MPKTNLENPLAHACVQMMKSGEEQKWKRSVYKFAIGDGSGQVIFRVWHQSETHMWN